MRRVEYILIFGALLAYCRFATAQLAVTSSAPIVVGNKAVVKLAAKNTFPQRIESARAALFLLDEQGKVAAQATKWVIGGQGNLGLAPGATNTFQFVITSDKPFTTTNLTAKLAFSRLVLEGGKAADPSRDVQILQAPK